ncbi:MAG: hypothetical protein COB76_02180 [Alphaproteobacteria bacterium]|nr:MAG: hypothetical protein COB76_02180 [Alphaproteobacteria bacterium]
MQDTRTSEMKATTKSKWCFIKYILFGLIIAGSSFYAVNFYSTKNMKIMYISQSEILALEKERISVQSANTRQLFFGKPKEAITHIEQIQKSMTKNGTIILLADRKIYGNNVTSVSKQVHEKMIEMLKRDN